MIWSQWRSRTCNAFEVVALFSSLHRVLHCSVCFFNIYTENTSSSTHEPEIRTILRNAFI